MKGTHFLLAYHGCDVTTQNDLIAGRLKVLEQSQNDYDWLGPGAYFFENDPQRALQFAQTSASRPEGLFTRRPIVNPAVAGAVICVRSCLDMTTQRGIIEYENALEGLRGCGIPLARNEEDVSLLRRLNTQVFRAIHRVRADRDQAPYQMIRAAFAQGDAVGDGHSGFSKDGHIQLAVRDPQCIVAWFLPEEDRLMSDAECSKARAELAAAPTGAARKPRRRLHP